MPRDSSQWQKDNGGIMTLNEMRTLVRCDLRDKDETNYRWTDDELDRHISHAVKELSAAIPLEQTAAVATVNGSRELDISGLADRIAIQAVEYPVDRFPIKYRRFSVWGNTLTLADGEIPDGGNARIYYDRLHTLDNEDSTIPVHLDELIVSGACGYAAVEWAAFAINRVNTGGSTTPQEFLSWGKAKLDSFRSGLKRMGRKNRLRIRQMYKPYYQAAFKTTCHAP
jgi:hypothetical protein